MKLLVVATRVASYEKKNKKRAIPAQCGPRMADLYYILQMKCDLSVGDYFTTNFFPPWM